jgi:hypothetical protein
MGRLRFCKVVLGIISLFALQTQHAMDDKGQDSPAAKPISIQVTDTPILNDVNVPSPQHAQTTQQAHEQEQDEQANTVQKLESSQSNIQTEMPNPLAKPKVKDQKKKKKKKKLAQKEGKKEVQPKAENPMQLLLNAARQPEERPKKSSNQPAQKKKSDKQLEFEKVVKAITVVEMKKVIKSTLSELKAKKEVNNVREWFKDSRIFLMIRTLCKIFAVAINRLHDFPQNKNINLDQVIISQNALRKSLAMIIFFIKKCTDIKTPEIFLKKIFGDYENIDKKTFEEIEELGPLNQDDEGLFIIDKPQLVRIFATARSILNFKSCAELVSALYKDINSLSAAQVMSQFYAHFAATQEWLASKESDPIEIQDALKKAIENITEIQANCGLNALMCPDWYGICPLFYIVWLDAGKVLDYILGELKSKNEAFNMRDPEDQTLLMNAALFGCKNVVKVLLDHGADPNVQDRDGNVSLLYATELATGDKNNPYKEIVRMLKDKGSSLDKRNQKKETPLYTATCCAEINVVKLLLQYKANSDVACHGNSCLERAIQLFKKSQDQKYATIIDLLDPTKEKREQLKQLELKKKEETEKGKAQKAAELKAKEEAAIALKQLELKKKQESDLKAHQEAELNAKKECKAKYEAEQKAKREQLEKQIREIFELHTKMDENTHMVPYGDVMTDACKRGEIDLLTWFRHHTDAVVSNTKTNIDWMDLPFLVKKSQALVVENLIYCPVCRRQCEKGPDGKAMLGDEGKPVMVGYFKLLQHIDELLKQ